MFWSISVMLALEWLIAMVCRFTLHGAIHGLLVLALISCLLGLASQVHGGTGGRRRTPARMARYGLDAGGAAVRNSTYSANA